MVPQIVSSLPASLRTTRELPRFMLKGYKSWIRQRGDDTFRAGAYVTKQRMCTCERWNLERKREIGACNGERDKVRSSSYTPESETKDEKMSLAMGWWDGQHQRRKLGSAYVTCTWQDGWTADIPKTWQSKETRAWVCEVRGVVLAFGMRDRVGIVGVGCTSRKQSGMRK